jgi:hypothetical protein
MDNIGSLATWISNSTENLNKATTLNYCDALMSNISAQSTKVDPRLRAKEGIWAHQFLLELTGNTTMLKMLSSQTLLWKLNKALSKASGLAEAGLHSSLWLCNNNLLLESKDNKFADWLHKLESFKSELGLEATVKLRSFNVIAFFVPLTFNPKNEDHKSE